MEKVGQAIQRRRIVFLSILILAFVLRFFKLGENPPSLYWDEASLGYNAYAIASTAIDEHGEKYPLARFIAFGDYKPPGYIYLTALAIKFLGMSDWSIRLPSASAGFMMVFITYFLVKLLFKDEKAALVASLWLAISPWSLQLSRAAFEANLAAFFNLCGIYFFMLFIFKKHWFFLLSTLFFILSFYTFNANRIIAPFLLVALSLIWIKEWRGSFRIILLGLVFSLILLSPSFSYLKSRESRLRFQEVSIFTSLNSVKIANERIAREGDSFWGKLIHNRRMIFFQDFLKHYADHFDGRYLFISGDHNPRLSIQYVGELYLWEIPLLLPGFYYLFSKNKRSVFTCLVCLLVVIVPAATARETPHALRTASIFPIMQIFSGAGLVFWLRWLTKFNMQKRYIFQALFLSIFSASIYYYLHVYYIHAPTRWAGEWQYGYKELVEVIRQNQARYKSVVITRRLGRPYIYFLLFNHVDPSTYLASRRASRDWWGLWEVNGFGKYYFDVGFLEKVEKPVLFAGTPDEMPNGAHELKRIKSLSGKEVFVVSEL